MASTDIPPFLRDKMKKDAQAKQSDIPPFLQKKSGGESASPTLTVGSDGKLQQSVPTTSPLPLPAKPEITTAFDLPTSKTPTVTTNDGTAFPVNQVVANNFVQTKNTPYDIQALQNRVASKTTTDEDVAVLAQSSGKSVDATKAYINGGNLMGGSVENIENVNNTKVKLTNYINDYNTIYGTKYDPNDVLSSSQKVSDFLDVAKNKKIVPETTANPNQAVASSTRLDKNFADVPALLPTDISNEMIEQVVSKTVDEDKVAGIPKDQTVIKIAKRLNPKEFAKVSDIQAQPTLGTGLNPATAIGNLFRGNTNVDELLNTQKGYAELAYNQALKQNSINKISEGVISGNTQMVTDGQHDLLQVDDNVVDKYPALQKQEMIRRINETIAQESGVVVGSEAQDLTGIREKIFGATAFDRARIMKDLGYLDNPKTKDAAYSLLQNPSLFADNSVAGGTVSSFMQPFKDLGLSVADISGIRGSKDIYSDKIRDELFPKDFSQNTGDEPQLKTGIRIPRTIVNTTANLAGMVAISTATEGITGGLGASASLGQKLGAYTSFGLPSFDASLKDSKNFLESEPAQYIYAGINAIANAEGGRLLDLGKVTRIPGVSEDFATIAKGLSENSITEDATRSLLAEAKNKYVDFAVKYGKNVTKGAATMAYFTTANNIIKLGFGDPNTTELSTIQQAGHAFLDGVLGMSILGGFGAVADMKNERNTTYKGTIYNMALNHDAAKDVFDIGLKNGEYDKETYDNKVAILNTAVAAKDFLDIQEAEAGVNLNQDQKAVYVGNKTAENILREKAKNAQLPESKAKYEEQADRLKTQSNQILEGLDFNKNLEPLQDQFEVGKEYDAALENFNPDIPETVTALETAKTKLDATTNTKLSEPIAGLDAQGVPIKADNINTDFKSAEPFIITPEARKDVGDIVTRINNAEYINEKDLDNAANHLYDLLDKHGNNQSFSNLIEPLINKIEGYDFRTKTESSTVTEKVPIDVARPTVERKAVNKSISQWEGNRATVTDSNGKSVEGVINLQDGKYYLHNENGDKVAAIGDTAITDAHISFPSTEKVPTPIQFDENGDIKSMTLQLNKVDKEKGGAIPDKLITINFRDKEKALDYAIQLRAEQVGEFPQQKFDLAFEEIKKQVAKEVPVKDLSKNEQSTGEVNKPLQPNEQGQAQQGTETAVPKNAEQISRTESERAAAILENEKAIKNLEQERDTKIKEISKPDLKMDFVEEGNIPKIETDATYKGEVIGKKKIVDPKLIESQNIIKEKFNKLQELINCLTA